MKVRRRTIILFYQPSSSLEKEYLDALVKDLGDTVGIVTIALKSGTEPLALQLIQLTLIVVTLSIILHGVSVKPLLGLFWRRGKLPP